MNEAQIAYEIFKEAVNRMGRESGYGSHRLTESGLLITNSQGHEFVVNPECGPDNLMLHCMNNGIVLHKDYALEKRLREQMEAEEQEQENAEPEEAPPAPQPKAKPRGNPNWKKKVVSA